MPFWYNVDTKSVESDAERSRDANVMGPYDTRAEAEAALEKAAANTERWDEEDQEWEDRGAAPGWNDDDLED